MIGIVLIGHGHIASEMLQALQHVVGEQPLVESIDVADDSSPDVLTTMLQVKIQNCDIGNGVLVLADMFGGTPCNVAMGCLQPGHIEVISGFNLPLLIKAVTLRQQDKNVMALAQQVMMFGRQYIQVASSMIPNSSKEHVDGE